MARFKQTEEKYKHIYLGFGTGTIYSFGCYLVSLTNGLNEKGYAFTPEGLNDILKQNQAWTGEFNNYIDVDRLDDILPNIFTSFQKIEPWNDTPSLTELLKPDSIVVCKVDARPIGGTGTHFVLLTGKDNKTAIIHDPWTGKEEKITVRWNNYGNIQGLRIFKVKPFVPPQEQSGDVNNAMQQLVSEFKNLPDNDDLKKGNLEGYVRAITSEHKKFSEINEKAKILDGFIAKWQVSLNLSIKPDDTYPQILHKIEEQVASLMDKEDTLETYKNALYDYLAVFLPNDTLELITGDDKRILEELGKTRASIKEIKNSLTKCKISLENMQSTDVLYELPINGYIIRIIKK